MQIQINTDHNIEVHDDLADHFRSIVINAVGRFSSHITRIEVHLSDESSNKNTFNNKRCLIEARIENHEPIAASDEAQTVEGALDGASDKLNRMLESFFGKELDLRKE